MGGSKTNYCFLTIRILLVPHSFLFATILTTPFEVHPLYIYITHLRMCNKPSSLLVLNEVADLTRAFYSKGGNT